ncbi:MAG: transcription elongation factor GreA [Mycoplasmataceae bacterium]|jgi:transcription elongation factor GreA|nr:transcription elongation factor GreA [Mycoplasmataceae bacterium]
MIKNDNFLTKNGIDNLKKELKDLIEVKRPEIIKMIQSAREQGDLSENADYATAKDEQGKIESRIAEIKEILENASVIDEKHTSSKNDSSIHIGSKVTIETEDGEKNTYEIVGEVETDPDNNKISNKSPLARAIFGKKVGDVSKIHNIEKPYKVKIVKIVN